MSDQHCFRCEAPRESDRRYAKRRRGCWPVVGVVLCWGGIVCGLLYFLLRH